ncbi:DUF3455 domain-containing protein [Nitrosomonas sp. Nm58]|jgi:hypothetical protein|uniref:DUF3455 domain-containing protein n=1 Tax=Nitrosomonas sp. Nm58 TaxID=200126 RepID=UPI000897BCA7|nr:DUF3455 domain-containing protein [Nitrosomonas sp. Nm58]SDY98596.1 Protein of unknown function [Nitrosomonas sp. Nm58]
MKNCNTPENQTTRRILPIACAAALAGAITVSLPQSANAERVTPPSVPEKIEVPVGSKAFLVGHAVGTQNYICLPSSTGVAFKLFTPQATLFKENGKQIITHFFGPNPVEDDAIRAAWQHSRDTSTVWGQVLKPEHSTSDSDFVEPGAIPWLLVTVVGAQEGPTPGDNKLARTTFIQRLNTSGGVAPSTGCTSAADVGNQAFVPYTADYFFYTNGENDSI